MKVVTCTALLAAMTCFSAPARADIQTHHAIEWLVQSSDHVVEGTVIEVKPVPCRTDRRLVTLQRSETKALKGHKYDRFTAVLPGSAPPVGKKLIVFASMRRVPSACGPNPRTGELSWSLEARVTHVLDGRRAWTVVTRAFGFVQGLEALRDHIRKVAKAPQVHRSITLPVPVGTPLAPQIYFGSINLVVPRDAKTESYILTLLMSPEPTDRVLGTQLLAPYESVPNIERLLSMRDDQATIQVDGKPRRWVRDAAELTLKKWEVPLD